jgi:hypothetical protein
MKKYSHRGVKLGNIKDIPSMGDRYLYTQAAADPPRWTSIEVDHNPHCDLSDDEVRFCEDTGIEVDIWRLPRYTKRGQKMTRVISRKLNKLRSVAEKSNKAKDWQALETLETIQHKLLDAIKQSFKGTLYFTDNYSDILLCSDGRSWVSCYEIDGAHAQSTVHSYESGDLLAVFVREGTTKWASRAFVRRDPDGGYWIEPKWYGDGGYDDYILTCTVRQYLADEGLQGRSGSYGYGWRGYSDYYGESHCTPPVDDDDLIDDDIYEMDTQELTSHLHRIQGRWELTMVCPHASEYARYPGGALSEIATVRRLHERRSLIEYYDNL